MYEDGDEGGDEGDEDEVGDDDASGGVGVGEFVCDVGGDEEGGCGFCGSYFVLCIEEEAEKEGDSGAEEVEVDGGCVGGEERDVE